MAVMCPQCSTKENVVEFPTMQEYQKHVKAGHRLPEEEKKEEKPAAPPPIVLEYKYKGGCPECGRDVDTIVVDLEEKQKMIAYCPMCKKQFQQHNVIPLKDQFKKEGR